MLKKEGVDWQQFSLLEQIGQMIVVRTSGYLFDHQIRYPSWEANATTLKSWLEELHLGGVIVLGGSAGELSLRSQQLQQWSKTPLLIAADIEEGVGQRFPGATWFPPPFALGDLLTQNPLLAQDYARKMGAITAQEALSMGINWILAPVVDVNNNRDNPVINIRAFGEIPEVVSTLATAFIQGTQDYPILTTAKHFPGHGDTATDSHLDLPLLPHNLARLETVELPPFQEAIQAGVDSIMSAHLRIPAWDEERPATLSYKILTEQLRQKLGFEGLIVTDALIMGGVTKFAAPEEIAVMAVEAGADILLMPDNPEVAIQAVYDGVKRGRIASEQIAQSCQRIAHAKQKVLAGSENSSFSSLVPNPTLAGEINQQALKMGGHLPLQVSSSSPLRNLVVVDDILNCDFLDRQTPAIAIPQQLGYDLQLIDQQTLKAGDDDSRVTLLQIFVRGNPFRGRAGLTPEAQELYQNLMQSGQLQGLMIYGSPYVLDWFQPYLEPQLPWIFSYGQMPIAQKTACQRLFNLEKSEAKFTDTFL